ncbi:unnamed protein product [Moneuplotes crassus]|uniref:Uncharacterized protein n=1 Tax=Euplotes crassus TaxID=5936 RepID=A0AAD2D361_EUPCR|nr:unnamed protein product [Moneuplotes crassus]
MNNHTNPLFNLGYQEDQQLSPNFWDIEVPNPHWFGGDADMKAVEGNKNEIGLEDPYKNTFSMLKTSINFSDLTQITPDEQVVQAPEIFKEDDHSYLFKSDDEVTLFAHGTNPSAKPKQPVTEPTPTISREANSKGLKPGAHSTRQDVVNKTIIRSIKRYYCEAFADGNTMIYFLHKSDGPKCLRNIDQYCLSHFGPKLGILEADSVYSLQDFFDKKTKIKKMVFKENIAKFYEIKVTFACILLKIPMKKCFGFPFVKKAYNSIYEVLYNYSVRKLEKLFECQGMVSIFEHFCESGILDRLMKEDPTLSLNPEGYQKGVQRIKALCKA